MRILAISNVFPPGFIGGYELGAFDIVKNLAKKGHEVQVLTSDYFLDDHPETLGFSVRRTLDLKTIEHELIETDQFLAAYYNFRNIRVLGSEIRKFAPDMVIAFNLIGLGAVSIVQFLECIRMPALLYVMDNIFAGIEPGSPLDDCYYQMFGRMCEGGVIRSIAMSNNVVLEIEAKAKVRLPDVEIVPGWVQLQLLERRITNRKEPGFIRFVYCSRLAAHKGIGLLLLAAKHLIEVGETEFLIDVYGAGDVARLSQQIRALGLDRHVSYCGMYEKQEMITKLAHYDALLFPTWERETFGFVVSEAAAAGAIPVMTAGIGAGEWFLDGVDSLKISRTVPSLCSAMRLLMALPDTELLQMRNRAMSVAWEYFDFESCLDLIEQRCLELARIQRRPDVAVRQVESAFLLLSTLVRETLR